MQFFKRFYSVFVIPAFLISCLQAESVTVYEDAEDGQTDGWFIYDNEPTGATISNIHDDNKNSSVIQLKGNGLENAYWFKNKDGSYWHNLNQFTIEFDLKADDYVRFFISIQTKNGERILSYDHQSFNEGINGVFIHTGLGEKLIDGTWHTYRRNLLDDLKRAEPDNTLVSVNWIIIRGDALIDDIKLIDNISVAPPSAPNNFQADATLYNSITLSWNDMSDNENGFKIYRNGEYLDTTFANDTTFTDVGLLPETHYTYSIKAVNDAGESAELTASATTPVKPNYIITLEDAEDGLTKGWSVFDNEPQGASIAVIYDDTKKSNVIELKGEGLSNAFTFESDDGSPLNNEEEFIVDLSIRTLRANEYMRFFIWADTLEGSRAFAFDHSSEGTGLNSENGFIHEGLGEALIDGQWHTYTFDLVRILKQYEPENKIVTLHAFIVRGNAMVDDLVLRDEE